MALEQLLAFLDDRDLAELGPTVAIGPEGFPMLESSELAEEHALIGEFIEERPDPNRVMTRIYGGVVGDQTDFDLGSTIAGKAILAADDRQRTRYYQAFLERVFAYEAGLGKNTIGNWAALYDLRVAGDVLTALMNAGVDLDAVLIPTFRWFAVHRHILFAGAFFENLLQRIQDRSNSRELPSELRNALIDIRAHMHEGYDPGNRDELSPAVVQLLGDPSRQILYAGECWTDTVIDELDQMPLERREIWLALFEHCLKAKSAKPSAKWLNRAGPLLEAVGKGEFRKSSGTWFPLVDKGRTRQVLSWEVGDQRQLIHEINANILRGLLWLCPKAHDDALVRAIGQLAFSVYRKVRGIGPRSVKVGNAAVYALGEIADIDALGQLAILKVRVKFGTAQKGIEKALAATAEKIGVPRDELEEMAVPAYGLTEVGIRTEELGDYTAELMVDGPKPRLRWIKPDGKPQKSVPAAVKADFADDLKELKQAAKDIEKMLPAQSARIEQLYLNRKTWKLPVWRERYLDHPLVGALAQRLIWRFEANGETASAVFRNEEFIGHDDRPVDWIDEETTVSPWHPIDEKSDDITEWRDWFVRHEVKQPFKQAHREVYVLTDAERNTEVYSNRFAAHVLKQHQFNALCGARGWKNQLRLMVDDNFTPAHLLLRASGVRAEYWVEGAGEEYGVDTNETGTFLYLTTDQVRFYDLDAASNRAHAFQGGYESSGTDQEVNHPKRLEDIPPLAFSEVMRDVDLFVGVASVGADPTWADGGPEGRHREPYLEYWHDFSFGDLSATAKTRKEVLQGVIPRLKIADRCSFSDRFLVVRGDIRTYKIHLGSGNILMEPTDEYLCIVPNQSIAKGGDQVFLPFEGDKTLSIVLSKAFLLADDTKIKDGTIISQIGR